MLAEAFGVDELGFIDDPIDLPVGTDEVEERLQRTSLTVERVGGR